MFSFYFQSEEEELDDSETLSSVGFHTSQGNSGNSAESRPKLSVQMTDITGHIADRNTANKYETENSGKDDNGIKNDPNSESVCMEDGFNMGKDTENTNIVPKAKPRITDSGKNPHDNVKDDNVRDGNLSEIEEMSDCGNDSEATVVADEINWRGSSYC